MTLHYFSAYRIPVKFSHPLHFLYLKYILFLVYMFTLVLRAIIDKYHIHGMCVHGSLCVAMCVIPDVQNIFI